MASGHETGFINDTSSSSSSTEDFSGNFSDSSLPHGENVKSSFDSNKDSQPLFHQQHGNDPTMPQNLHSSHPQPLSSEMKPTPFNRPQAQNLSNVPESSQAMNRQSSENASVHDKRCKTRFSGVEDAVSHAEFIPIQNNHSSRQDLYAAQTRDIHRSHPTTIQCSEIVPTANQQFLSERLSFLENRSNTTQQMHTQTANGFSWTQSSCPSMQQFAERNTSRVQGYYSLPREQPWNEPVVSQISYSFSHQPHQNVSDIGQTAHKISHEVFASKSISYQARDYFHVIGGSSRIQDLPSQSFQNSVHRYEDIQSSYPQGIRQSESDPSIINMHSSSHPASRIKFNQDCGLYSSIQHFPSQSFQNSVHRYENIQSSYPQGIRQSESEPHMINMHSSSDLAPRINFNRDCGLYSSTREILNRTTSNQDLHSRNVQPDEKETHDNPELHPLPQTLTEYTNKLQFPNLQSELQFKRESLKILLAKSQRNRPDTFPLAGNSLDIGSFMNKKQNISFQQASAKVIREEYVDLTKLEHPYADRSESINIFVCGRPHTTKCLLQTFSGINTLECSGPYSFAFKRNYTRCGILMKLSIWKIDKMSECIPFLKSHLSTRSTVIYVFNDMDTNELLTLKILIEMMRKGISRKVPIIIVKRKPAMEISDVRITYKGFKLKAHNDLSAYLEYSSNSKEEAEAVIFTALDVSILYKF